MNDKYKLKILLTAHIKWYNAEADYILRLARGLLSRGHDVLVWGINDSPIIERARAGGVPVFTNGNPGSLDPTKLTVSARALDELIRRGGFNIVNAHRSEGYPVIARTAKRAGAGVVRTRGDMRKPKFAFLNKKVYERWTDRVIVANDLIKEDLIIRLGLPEEKVHTIRLGIDPDGAQPGVPKEAMRKELGIGADAPVAAVMGRLGPVKGHEFFLRAAKKVIDSVPKAMFLVIYQMVEDCDKFLPTLERSGLRDKFVLVGPRERPADVAQLAQVAVIPSVGSEAHCRVALEWMALGVPVVGSRVGVIPEIIEHGDTGFLVQPRYSDTLAHCITRLLKNPSNSKLMGRAGKERLINFFHEDKMVEDNLEVFRGLARDKH